MHHVPLHPGHSDRTDSANMDRPSSTTADAILAQANLVLNGASSSAEQLKLDLVHPSRLAQLIQPVQPNSAPPATLTSSLKSRHS